jgi:sugar phosphate isomerase/epimerase
MEPALSVTRAASLPGRFVLKATPMKRIFSFSGLTLTAIALLTGCATNGVGTGSSFKGPVGLQLYSLRHQFAKDVPGTLTRVHDYGLKYVELAGTYNLSIDEFNRLLAERQLKAISGHFPFDRYSADPEGVARDAKALGLQFAGCAWIPHQGAFDLAEARHAAAVFNRAGEVLARHGIKFFYHIHGYEFQPHDGGTLFDLIMAETNPAWVHYQMDVFWVVHPGQDPVQLLEKYGQRFVSMHLKDMKKGVQGDLTGKSDVNNDVALGTGPR